MTNQEKVLDISWKTILRIAIAGLVFYLLYFVRDILIWIIFAIIISVLFNPAINFLQKKRIPRGLSTALVYLTILGILGLIIYISAPLFISEIQQFSRAFPQYFERISPVLRGLGIEALESFENFTAAIEGWLAEASTNIFSAIGVIFGGIFSTVAIFAIAAFLSLEEKGPERIIGILAPKKYEALVLSLWEKSQRKVSGWFGARILCCFFVGLMTFVTCHVLDIEYAASFGLLAGIFDFVPIIGPVLVGVMITLFVALDFWGKAAIFLIAFIIIQQIEGNLLTPVLTKKFIGLPPALVLIALIIGGKLWGILGAVLAIPVAGILFEFLRDFLKKKKERETTVL